MTATIYHNPRCSKSRQTLEIIQGKGIEPTIIDYIRNSPDLSELKELFEKLKIVSVLSMVRIKEQEFKDSNLNKDSSNDELLSILAEHPRLLERPIVVTYKGACICRPPELVEDIL